MLRDECKKLYLYNDFNKSQSRIQITVRPGPIPGLSSFYEKNPSCEQTCHRRVHKKAFTRKFTRNFFLNFCFSFITSILYIQRSVLQWNNSLYACYGQVQYLYPIEVIDQRQRETDRERKRERERETRREQRTMSLSSTKSESSHFCQKQPKKSRKTENLFCLSQESDLVDSFHSIFVYFL